MFVGVYVCLCHHLCQSSVVLSAVYRESLMDPSECGKPRITRVTKSLVISSAIKPGVALIAFLWFSIGSNICIDFTLIFNLKLFCMTDSAYTRSISVCECVCWDVCECVLGCVCV